MFFALKRFSRLNDPSVYMRVMEKLQLFSSHIVGYNFDDVYGFLKESEAFEEPESGKLKFWGRVSIWIFQSINNPISWGGGIKKSEKDLILSPTWYPEPGSNRHGSESTGVWDQRVYQFRHLGISKKWMQKYAYFWYFEISGPSFLQIFCGSFFFSLGLGQE